VLDTELLFEAREVLISFKRGWRSLRIIPVMDLLGGVVVHARKGMRDEYRPVESVLSNTAQPVEVAKAFRREFKFKELYVADLDAILGKDIATDDIMRISRATPMKIMVDAGINSVETAQRLRDAGASKIIVATETLQDLNTLSLIIDELGSNYIISSLDLKDRRVLSKSIELRTKPPVAIAKMLEESGVSQLIVLELTKVGSESGVDRTMAESIVNSVKVPVIAGGGVRNVSDLVELEEIGVDGVLVATSLHTGSITPHDLRSFE
jgi:phosphoribosylformimino-5-aminoimidazole carboxamide ribotide isomerase